MSGLHLGGAADEMLADFFGDAATGGAGICVCLGHCYTAHSERRCSHMCAAFPDDADSSEARLHSPQAGLQEVRACEQEHGMPAVPLSKGHLAGKHAVLITLQTNRSI